MPDEQSRPVGGQSGPLNKQSQAPAGPRPLVEAAGLVVWRTGSGGTEVLTVHRPVWSDWVLPKGHIEAGELPPEAACREFAEETGYEAVAGCPVAVVDYPVGKTAKRVHWWVGQLTGAPGRAPANAREVDAVAWRPVADALAALTYEDERQVLTQALALRPTRTMLILRHAKTVKPDVWGEGDASRPLTARGERQAGRLARLLGAYGVGALAQATAVRCRQTVQPYAQARHIDPQSVAALADANACADPAGLVEAMRQLRDGLLKTAVPVAVCGHGPHLAAMAQAVGLDDIGTAPMKPAETLVLHLDASGRPQAWERYMSLL